MAKRELPEIVEVFSPIAGGADGSGSFTGRVSAPVAPEGGPSRRRWIAPAALAAVAALVVVVAVATSGDDSPRTTRPAATSTTSSTVADTTASLGPPTALKLVPDTPAGYRVQYAAQSYSGREGPDGSSHQLWANGDNAASAGWFQIDAYPADADDSPTSFQSGQRRVAIPLGVAVLGTDDPGLYRIASGPIAGGSASITTVGLRDDQLVELLEGMQLTDSLVLGTTPAGYDLVAEQSANTPAIDMARFNTAGVAVSYGTPDGLTSVGLATNVFPSAYDEATTQFFSQSTTVTLEDGTAAVLSSDSRSLPFSTGGHPYQQLAFEKFGVPVQIYGNAPQDVLLGVAASVHLAGTDEWTALQTAGTENNQLSGQTTSTPTQRVDVAQGTADTVTWKLSIDVSLDALTTPSSRAMFPDALDIGVTTAEGQSDVYATQRVAAPGIQVIASEHLTVVVGFVDFATTGAVLEVTEGDWVVRTPLSVATPASLVGAYGFPDLEPFTARIIAADGTVLATATG